ncbi:MAG: tetratricopeptide repeat protein [Spirochaetota bacterium]
MKKFFAFCLICLCTAPSFAAKLKIEGNPRIKIFFTEGDLIGGYGSIVGSIDSIGTRELSDEKDKEVGRNIQGKTKALVRLSDAEGVTGGSVVYVINDRNLVVSKIVVQSVFSSLSLDKMCVGYGNCRNSQKDFRVVRIADENLSSDASALVAQGDYFRRKGDISKAIETYEKALSIDKTNPEAHSALGYIYLDQKMLQFAVKEFNYAYAAAGRVYDREEKFLLLQGCAQSRYMSVFFSELPKGNPVRDKYVTEGIRFAQEALSFYPDSADMNFYLGMFYYEKGSLDQKLDTDNDLKVHECMIKTIRLKSDYTAAYIIIAKIYKKHNNKEKAELYAQKAVSLEPANADARELFSVIRKMK